MSRSRVPVQLLANLQSYHTYLLQDPCANPRAWAYVEAHLTFCQGMNSRRSDSTGSGELAELVANMSSFGRNRSSASKEREIVTT